ncbi:MAG: apolipoprotein N-acyltransferase, partial [Alphaproteobacteria bacterium]|nr:apolipoprotein N-acyltransferase [Alphaproteobacteria bacterium]
MYRIDGVLTQNTSCPWIQSWASNRLSMMCVGLMGALMMAPLHVWLAGVVSIVLLMLAGWMCVSGRQAQRCAWWWGYGFYMGSLYWIGHGLWVDAARFAWFWPVVFLVSPAILAIYTALMMGIVVRVKVWLDWSCLEYALGFALMWATMEWIQGHAFTGFPWTLVAYMWGDCLPVAQMVAYVGVYGLGLLTVCWIAVMGWCILDAHQRSKSVMIGLIRGCGVGVLGIGMCSVLGVMRLVQYPTQYHEKIVLRCVQPAIDQKEKIDPSYATAHWDTLWTLSHTPLFNPPIVVIWPEGALPWSISPDTRHALPEFDAPVVFIGGDYRDDGDKIYNTLLMKRSGCGVVPLYAKQHLLPFGEYFPGRSWLEKIVPKGVLAKVTPGAHDFSTGAVASTVVTSTGGWPTTETAGFTATGVGYLLTCPELPPFRCLICYESIFPGTIRMPSVIPKTTHSPQTASVTAQHMDPLSLGKSAAHPTQRNPVIQPEWILNITNDGWFGQSWGPYQHFVCAR